MKRIRVSLIRVRQLCGTYVVARKINEKMADLPTLMATETYVTNPRSRKISVSKIITGIPTSCKICGYVMKTKSLVNCKIPVCRRKAQN